MGGDRVGLCPRTARLDAPGVFTNDEKVDFQPGRGPVKIELRLNILQLFPLQQFCKHPVLVSRSLVDGNIPQDRSIQPRIGKVSLRD